MDGLIMFTLAHNSCVTGVIAVAIDDPVWQDTLTQTTLVTRAPHAWCVCVCVCIVYCMLGIYPTLTFLGLFKVVKIEVLESVCMCVRERVQLTC